MGPDTAAPSASLSCDWAVFWKGTELGLAVDKEDRQSSRYLPHLDFTGTQMRKFQTPTPLRPST